MIQLGTKTEIVKCPKCKKMVQTNVLSEYLGTPSIRGVEINKTIKIENHKIDGFFSRKCDRSGSTVTLSSWHPSDKVMKTLCKYCKRDIDGLIINVHSRNNGWNRDVTITRTTVILKLLHHKKGSRRCNGTGRMVKEKKVTVTDNNHP